MPAPFCNSRDVAHNVSDRAQDARLALLRGSHVVAEREDHLEWPHATAGVYRVEVYLPGWEVPWIVSNPITSSMLRRTRLAASGGCYQTTPVSASRRVLDDFDGETHFEPASDTSTAVASPMIEPQAGPDGSAAARLQFTLGGPAALARPVPEDLSGSQGLY